MLTIVMYHYVRDLTRSRFPEIKGLDTVRFDGQLDYIGRHYTVVSLAGVLAAARGVKPLPDNACVLSFDDGFIDHYTVVFPRLDRRGWPGCFFPPGQAILENKVLDVHKIHVVLASTSNPAALVGKIFEYIGPFRKSFDIPSDEALYAKWGQPGRYDPPEIAFVKKMLQRELPEVVRTRLVDALFAEIIPDEAAFAKEFYLDIEQMQHMARYGMEFGGHGYRHVWLGTLSDDEQREEVERTVEFLQRIRGGPLGDWAIGYPYGSYNPFTLKLMREAGCEIGLTTEVNVVKDLSRPLELERLNTNDLPCSAAAELADWTKTHRAAVMSADCAATGGKRS